MKYTLLLLISLLLVGCPTVDDGPDFYVSLNNKTGEGIYFHVKRFNDIIEIPSNSLYDWDPHNRDDRFLQSNSSQDLPFVISEKIKIYSIWIYNEPTFQDNDWETIRDEGLFDAQYNLTYQELEALDFTIDYDGN